MAKGNNPNKTKYDAKESQSKELGKMAERSVSSKSNAADSGFKSKAKVVKG